MSSSFASGRSRAPAWRAALRDLVDALAGRAPRSMASGFLSSAIVAGAGMPFAGWRLPAVWFLFTAALVAASHAYAWRVDRAGRDSTRDFNPFTWLISAAYSGAAFYLVWAFGGAAQTLGVTLYGVVMFQILARDYAAPSRLAANLAAPVVAMVIVQVGASLLLLHHGEPWKLATLFASPLVVFRAFRAVQINLERSQAEAREALGRLGESETRYRLLAERSPDIIIKYDTAGIVDYVSPAAADYGYDADALVGRNVTEFLDPADHDRNQAFLDDLAAGRPTPQGAENVWRTWAADGTPIAFEGATSVLRDEAGAVLGAMSSLRDVTARVALEDELRKRRAEAEAANEAKTQFLANMSHEVRTPLTGVIGFARLLAAMDLSEAARGHVDRIEKSGEALLAVVNDILDFSKLEAGRVDLDPQPFDLPSFLDETVDLVRPRAAEKGLSVALTLTPDLPACVDGDSGRVRQVLLNLLTNAVKFTDAGQVAVRAGYASGRLRVEVADTGPGISPEAAARLFQRFSQVDQSNARLHGGSGLGLAISKGLVEMMGGEIGLTSAPGAGSTFWFSVMAPIVASAAGPPTSEPPPAREQELVDGPLSILVVDDVAINRELVTTILAPFDIACVMAGNGQEAVDAACAQSFDLILMDLQMPGMDGIAATRAIRSISERNRTTPILAISANVLSPQIEAALAAGMNDHIAKPISPADLITKVSQWGYRAKLGAPTAAAAAS